MTRFYLIFHRVVSEVQQHVILRAFFGIGGAKKETDAVGTKELRLPGGEGKKKAKTEGSNTY